MVLPDTSIWIDFIQYKKVSSWTENFARWLRNGEIATCGVIMAEFIPFIQNASDRAYAEIVFETLQYLSPLSDLEFWKNVTRHQRNLSQNGIYRIGIADLIIIELSRANGASIISHDQHFQMAQKVISFDLIKPSEL